MTHTSDTTLPVLRRDLLAIVLWLAVAVLVYRVGHIPGVVNSATLIAAASSLWAGLKLVSVLRRLHKRVEAFIRAGMPDNTRPVHQAPLQSHTVLQRPTS